MSKLDNEQDRVRESASERTLLTYDDYRRLPDNGPRYELVKGELRLTPSPKVNHQEVSKRLGSALISWVEGRGLGKVYYAPLDVVLDRNNVVQPDLLFISRERSEIITEANIQGAPDLVVEIISPGSVEWDRITKRQLYERFGVREYWLVDPEAETIEVAVRQGEKWADVHLYRGGAALASPVLPGFDLDMSLLFAK